MDLSKDDLLRIEHALTRESWRSEPVTDLLFRIRTELLDTHGVKVTHSAPAEPDVTGPLVQPDPKRTKPWPELKGSSEKGR